VRSFSAGEGKEIIVLALDSGDDILESVHKAIEEEDIENGVFLSGLGSLSEVKYHIVAEDEKSEGGSDWKNLFFEKKGKIEVMSVTGLIASREPHLHITLSQDDQAFGGHLEEGSKVLTVAELVIMKLGKNMFRKVGEEGYGRLFLNSEKN